MAKKKHIWNKGMATLWYMHPFKDEWHLRKKKIRWPRWEPDSDLVEVWSEEIGCWFVIPPEFIHRIYKLLN